jgi:hypothetical protein
MNHALLPFRQIVDSLDALRVLATTFKETE